MSWWNTSSIGSFATQALKNAQKQIDKVLDIEDEEGGSQSKGESKLSTESSKTADDGKTSAKEQNTWNSWLVSDTNKSEGSKSETRSSWSLPSWGIPTDEKSSSSKKTSLLASSTQSGKSTTTKGKDILRVNKQRDKDKSPPVSEEETKAKDKEKESETVLKTDVEKKLVKLKDEKTVDADVTQTEIKQDLPVGPVSSEIEKVKILGDEASERLIQTDSESRSETNTLTDKNETISDSTEHICDKDKLLELTGEVEKKSLESSSKNVSEKLKDIDSDSVENKETLNICDDKKTIQSVECDKITGEKDDDKNQEHKTSDNTSVDQEYSSDKRSTSESETVLPSASSDEIDDVNINTTGQSDSKESFVSDLGQSGWASDVSWESFGDTKQLASDPVGNVDSAKNRNISGELKVETEMLQNQKSDTETNETLHTETLNQSASLENSEIDRTEIFLESNKDDDSENKVENDIKSEEISNNISYSESSASLEIIESSEVIHNVGNSETEIHKTEDSEHYTVAQESAQGDVMESKSIDDSVIKSGFTDEDDNIEQTEAVNLDTQTDETLTDDKQSDPAEAYINEVVSQDLPLSPSAASSLGGTDSDNSKLDSSMDTYTSEDTVVDRDRNEKEEEEAEADVEEVNDNSASSGSPSSSFVKCMLEDAMEDGCKMEDNGSDSHSTGGEKSECSRSTGGHESGDEIDTTTSSDIEIISTPTSNGNDKVIDLSPLKIALQKTAKKGSQTHRRSDSQSSSSTQSREGHGEQLSPGRDQSLDRHISDLDHHGYCEDLPPLSEETDNDPYHPQKLLKKLAEMSEILQARENKLVQMSHENNDLLEANSILRNQLQQSEEARESEMEDLNNLSSEFSERMAESEKKLQTVIREKEMMKKQLQQAQEDFGKKDSNVAKVLQEKDQQISELLQEGEKLSKQQLQSNNIIKKLRVKEKESDSLVASQKKKLEEQKTELEHLKKVLDSKEEMEKKQTDAINQLNAAVQKQEREMSKYKSEYEDNQERIRGLQSALDSSYKEIAELNKSNAAQDSKAQETALSVEMQVREELKLMLEREQLKHKHEKEALLMQMEDLRLTMSRMEKDHSRREDLLRQEISDLQVQLQEDEVRNQELTQSVTSATRPLLRQIENLQSTYTAQSTSWEKIEKNLSDRLIETQTQLANAVEKERCASEKLMELSTKLTSLETQNSHLKQDKSQLTAEMEITKTKVEVLEDAKTNEMAQIEAIKHQMNQEIAQLKKEKMFVETQLDMEKTKVEQEKKKLAIAQDQITQMEREVQRTVSRGTPSPVSVSRTESISSEPPMFSSLTQEDLERSFFFNNPSFGGTKTSLYESLRQSGAANLLENLQSQLKLREGEIIQLQNDIQQLERTRESMARELVNLSNQNEELQEKVKELPEMIEKYRELDQKNNALLLMYGEKVEEANELRMDLEDVKDMYKTQIDHLLAK